MERTESLTGRGPGVAAVIFGNATSLTACRYGLLLLRLYLGVTFLAHGSQKLFGWFGGPGWDGTVAMVSKLGPMFAAAPVPWAVLHIFAEFGCGLLLVIGLAPRIFAIPVMINMIVALSAVHVQKLHQGFIETFGQQAIIVACLAMIIAGGGAWSIWPARGTRVPCAGSAA